MGLAGRMPLHVRRRLSGAQPWSPGTSLWLRSLALPRDGTTREGRCLPRAAGAARHAGPCWRSLSLPNRPSLTVTHAPAVECRAGKVQR